MKNPGNRTKLAVAMGLLAMVSAGTSLAQQLSESPVELVRRTVQREVAAADCAERVMFLDRKETQHGSQTKLIVETREGDAGMVVANNDRPLTSEQRQAEEAHLEALMDSPSQLKKKQRTEKDDAERITRIMKALPDAFLYESDGNEVGNQKLGRDGDRLVRLKFRPNPKYNPPSHVEQVLTGMQGYLLIDVDQCRIAKIDGTLIKDVGFGWGVLGHLDKTGHFMVEQAEVVKGRWELTRMSLSFTGKILLFKSLNIKSDEVFTNFRPVTSNLTFAQGVEVIKKEEAVLAQNQREPLAGNSK